MLRKSVTLVFLVLQFGACRTTGSHVRDADTAAIKQAVKETIHATYTSLTAAQEPVVDQFANALAGNGGAKTLDEVNTLLANKKSGKQGRPGNATFDEYVVQEFPALTNYIAFYIYGASQQPLVFIGKKSQ